MSSVERQREKLGFKRLSAGNIHISSATTEIIGYEGDNGGSQLYNTIGKKTTENDGEILTVSHSLMRPYTSEKICH